MDWLEPLRRDTEKIRRENIEIRKETEILREQNKALKKLLDDPVAMEQLRKALTEKN